MSEEKKYHFETLQLHVGQEQADPATDSRAVPIYQTTSYVFRNSQHAADRFALKDAGNVYGRLTNPTEDVFEKRIAALEGGVGAMLTSSGQAASLLSVLNLCSAGDSIVSVSTIYGGTVNLFGVTLKRFGIECIWVDPLADEETISQAIQPNTKLIFGETIANPALTVFDIEKFAKIAHAHQIPLDRKSVV